MATAICEFIWQIFTGNTRTTEDFERFTFSKRSSAIRPDSKVAEQFSSAIVEHVMSGISVFIKATDNDLHNASNFIVESNISKLATKYLGLTHNRLLDWMCLMCSNYGEMPCPTKDQKQYVRRFPNYFDDQQKLFSFPFS